jgi:beta-glucosidase
MEGRTYRYFGGTPLYPFGHGLSYSTFEYGNLRVGSPTLAPGDTLRVQVDVTNTSERVGEEVVQLYVRYPDGELERPRLELQGFRRVEIQPGDTHTVEIPLVADRLQYWNADEDRWVLQPGVMAIAVGASSTDLRLRTEVKVEE